MSKDKKFQKSDDTKATRRNSRRRPSPSSKRSNGNTTGKDYSGRDTEKVVTATERNNDASWWNKFGNLTDVACNLSWNVMNGAPRSRAYTADQLTIAGVPTSGVLPTDMGVALIETIPNLGACHQIGDPINKASIEIYNMVRWNKNANVPYDPADITKLLWAYDSFISYLACMRRFYALTNAVDPRNRYVATYLLTAMGVDANDFYAHRAELMFRINQLAIQAAKINIPAEFKVFDRHELLYDNVFLDANIARGTYYIFMPRVLCKYDDASTSLKYFDFINGKTTDDFDGSSAIMPTDVLPEGASRKTVADLIAIGDQMLDAIQTSADFYMLNANIYGAYSERGLHPVKVIDSFYSITPLYREEVLSQIHNMDFADVDLTTLTVDENTTEGDPDLGAVRFTPSVPATTAIDLGYNKIVDVPWENPSKDDVLEATRLKMTAVQDPGKIYSTGYYIDSCGTEIALSMSVWFFRYWAGYWHFKWYESRGQISTNIVDKESATQLDFFVNEVAYMSKIDRYPLTTLFKHFEGTQPGTLKQVIPVSVLGNMDNYAMIDTNQLHNIHTAALLSVLLNGPTVLSHPVQETK